MPNVNVHGVNLYYEEYGTGPAVILTRRSCGPERVAPHSRAAVAAVPRHPPRSPQLWAL